jgi:hypothetical protein
VYTVPHVLQLILDCGVWYEGCNSAMQSSTMQAINLLNLVRTTQESQNCNN